jgi:hypothetical protein
MKTTSEIQLSKMQRVRKRELRRAIQRLHQEIKESAEAGDHGQVYGLRVAISVIGKMRRDVDQERR